ncbi:MAG: shikimate dehydrogenase [Ferruginibacter sp.]
MKTYGLIGFPLTHSFSQKYFTEKIEREGVADAVFHSFPLTTIDDLPALLEDHPSITGLAVTIPYKEKVMKYVTHVSEEVKLIGAANCIKIRGAELSAYNTDIIGFEKSFAKHLKTNHKKALVLGSGGSSKAVQYVLQKLKIDFLVVSRNKTEAENSIQYQQITESLIKQYPVIINTTPLGMSPDENTWPDIPYALLTAENYLYDLVYTPAKTMFLQKGAGQGAVIKNGFEMLIIQAEENWKRWNED